MGNMPNWLLYSLSATLFYGIMNFLYKIAAERRYMTPAVVLMASLTVVLCAAITFLIEGTSPDKLISALPYALANGTLFAFGALSKIKALKLAPASVVFPVNKSNVFFVILIGLFFFGDSPSPHQWLGISSSIVVLILLSSEQISLAENTTKKGLAFALLAALCTSFSLTAGKLASTRVDRTSYIFLSYSIVVLVSLATYRKRTTHDEKKRAFKSAGVLYTGGLIGLLNYFGYRLVLSAYATGSLSLVQPVMALSILIPIGLSSIVYREKLTFIRVISIGLTLASILLIKTG